MPESPLTPDELNELVETTITDPLLRQNTAAVLRFVLKHQNASFLNRLTDGTAGGNPPDYAALVAALNGKQTKVRPRLTNEYGSGIPDRDLPALEAQLDWLFPHAGVSTKGPNPTPSAAYKQVIFLTKDEAIAAGRPNCATLDQLDPLTLCTGAVVRVDLYPGNPGQELILCYSPDGPIRAFIDGNLKYYFDLSTDGLNPNDWFKKDSQEAVLAGIRRYSSTYDKWGKDETMKIDFGGTDAFFSAVAAGGPFAAPTAPGDATADWKPAAQPYSASFAPLLTSELNADKAAYAGLSLRPLLIKIVNALGASTGGGTITPSPSTGTPTIYASPSSAY